MNTVALASGSLAYDDSHPGDTTRPVVLCLPSLGDVRAEYRFLTPRLVAGGLRVLTMDLRGHGDSSAHWPSYEPRDLAADALAVLDHAGVRDAHLVGCSISASAGVLAATDTSSRITGLTLIGAFVRDLPGTGWMRHVIPLLFADFWGVAVWGWFYRSLYKAHPPEDLDAYVTSLKDGLRRPGRLAALRGILSSLKAESEARLGDVRVPTLVLMGTADPDFPDAAAEAAHIQAAIAGSETLLLPGLGHYPHVEDADAVATAILARMRRAA
jgi:pimeloyl-ACP methyl ester carboxylesterase